MALRQYGRASRYNGFDRFEFDLRAYAPLRFPSLRYATTKIIYILYATIWLFYLRLVIAFYSTEFSVIYESIILPLYMFAYVIYVYVYDLRMIYMYLYMWSLNLLQAIWTIGYTNYMNYMNTITCMNTTNEF